MAVLFFDAFENLDVPDKLKNEFSNVQVEKVIASHSHNSVQVRVISRHILNKKDISLMEKVLAAKGK